MRKWRIVLLISAVCCAEMAVGLWISAVGGAISGFWMFGFFMIVGRMGRWEICKFQFL